MEQEQDPALGRADQFETGLTGAQGHRLRQQPGGPVRRTQDDGLGGAEPALGQGGGDETVESRAIGRHNGPHGLAQGDLQATGNHPLGTGIDEPHGATPIEQDDADLCPRQGRAEIGRLPVGDAEPRREVEGPARHAAPTA